MRVAAACHGGGGGDPRVFSIQSELSPNERTTQTEKYNLITHLILNVSYTGSAPSTCEVGNTLHIYAADSNARPLFSINVAFCTLVKVLSVG